MAIQFTALLLRDATRRKDETLNLVLLACALCTSCATFEGQTSPVPIAHTGSSGLRKSGYLRDSNNELVWGKN